MSEVMNPNNPDGPMSTDLTAPQVEQSAPVKATQPEPVQATRPAPIPAAQAAPATPVTQATPTTQTTTTTATGARPGLVTFAAVMMFLIAAFQIIFALVEFYNAAWFANTAYGNFSDRLWLWGIVDLVAAAIAIYAGYDLLRGGKFGHIVGLIAAAIIGVRWFFYLPADPWAGVVMIALCVLVIYGLVAHSDYFDAVHVKQ